MAPKPGKKSNKTSGKALGAKKDSKTRVSKPSSSSKSSGIKRPPPQEQKSKSANAINGKGKSKRRHYSEKELGIPQLNMITPIGVAKPKGKKKGKVFVDDPHSMMTIMAMVNAEKEGQIESKMLRARQLEEIRTLKRQEQEEREAARREKLEDTKNSLRKKRLRKGKDTGGLGAGTTEADGAAPGSAARAGGKKKKKVSFG